MARWGLGWGRDGECAHSRREIPTLIARLFEIFPPDLPSLRRRDEDRRVGGGRCRPTGRLPVHSPPLEPDMIVSHHTARACQSPLARAGNGHDDERHDDIKYNLGGRKLGPWLAAWRSKRLALGRMG